MIIGKTFTFEAAHFLPGHEKCGRVHGHTYRVDVEVSGPLNKEGMVMDLHYLSNIVRELTEAWDHTTLNDIFKVPTCEHLAEAISNYIKVELPKDVQLRKVKVQEGEGGYAIFTDFPFYQ